MPPERFPIPQGALDLLILRILSLEPGHGYGIAQRLKQVSRGAVRIDQGSLYPALHRLEEKRWLRAEWHATDTGREAGIPYAKRDLYIRSLPADAPKAAAALLAPAAAPAPEKQEGEIRD